MVGRKWLEEQERANLARDSELLERALRAADRSIPHLSSTMFLAENDGNAIPSDILISRIL